jgi:hypothetical protein
MFRFTRIAWLLPFDELQKRLHLAKANSELQRQRREAERLGLPTPPPKTAVERLLVETDGKPSEDELEEAQEKDKLDVAVKERLMAKPTTTVDEIRKRKEEFDREQLQAEKERRANTEAYILWRSRQMDKGFAQKIAKKIRRQEGHRRQQIEKQKGRIIIVTPS